jgi:hypothetical protein
VDVMGATGELVPPPVLGTTEELVCDADAVESGPTTPLESAVLHAHAARPTMVTLAQSS